MIEVVGADASASAEGNTDGAKRRDTARRPGSSGPTGVESQGMRGEGCPGTWEIPLSPAQQGAEPPSERKRARAGQREVGAPQ